MRFSKTAIAAGAAVVIAAGAAWAAFSPYITITTLTGNELILTGPRNSTPVYVYDGQFATGHLPPPTGAGTPALTSCGTSPAITGNDGSGTVTMGTGSPTGCVITFAKAYTTAPNCVVVWQGTPLAAQNYTVTGTAITLVQTGTSSNLVNYRCDAQIGG